jgi:hypothetical protein
MDTKQLEITTVKDLDQAKDLWAKFSPNKSIYDWWDFRYVFYKYFNYELFFYTLLDNKEPVALFPLQYDTENNYMDFFGGSYMEDNQVFVKPGYEDQIPNLYAQIKTAAKMEDIIGPQGFTTNLPLEDYKYVIYLEQFSSGEDYIRQSMQGKSRKNLLYDLRKFSANDIKIIENDFSDLDLMIDLIDKTFNTESSFNFKHRREIFHDLLNLPGVNLMSYYVNGKKGGVSMSIAYQDNYVLLGIGSDNPNFPNLGKYMTIKNIDKAISQGKKLFDTGVGDCNWKKHWRLSQIPQYKFIKSETVRKI